MNSPARPDSPSRPDLEGLKVLQGKATIHGPFQAEPITTEDDDIYWSESLGTARWAVAHADTECPETCLIDEISEDNALFVAGALNTLPSLIAHVERLEANLRELEEANDNLCGTRSQATYLMMIDNDGAMDALDRLDDARRLARATLSQGTRHE